MKLLIPSQTSWVQHNSLAGNYLSMLELKLNHVDKRGPISLPFSVTLYHMHIRQYNLIQSTWCKSTDISETQQGQFYGNPALDTTEKIRSDEVRYQKRWHNISCYLMPGWLWGDKMIKIEWWKYTTQRWWWYTNEEIINNNKTLEKHICIMYVSNREQLSWKYVTSVFSTKYQRSTLWLCGNCQRL